MTKFGPPLDGVMIGQVILRRSAEEPVVLYTQTASARSMRFAAQLIGT